MYFKDEQVLLDTFYNLYYYPQKQFVKNDFNYLNVSQYETQLYTSEKENNIM